MAACTASPLEQPLLACLAEPLSKRLLNTSWYPIARSKRDEQVEAKEQTKPAWDWLRLPTATSQEHGAASSLSADQMDAGCLSLVFSNLFPRDLARAQVVCRQWRMCGTRPEVMSAAFRQKWSLSAVHVPPTGQQRAWAFLQSVTGVESFVRKHAVQPGESIAGIAIRYGVDVNSLKRVNNVISEHSLWCRACVYIPVFRDASELLDQVVTWEYDTASKRSFAVVTSPVEASQAATNPGDGQQAEGSSLREHQLQKKMCSLLSKSLRIDESAARYYLDEAGGDMKVAMKMAELDASWEQSARRGAGSRFLG